MNGAAGCGTYGCSGTSIVTVWRRNRTRISAACEKKATCASWPLAWSRPRLTSSYGFMRGNGEITL